jgi:hypothetical protein
VHQLVAALLVLAVVGVGITVGAIALVVHTLAVRNRVVPGLRSPAPLGWLWSTRLAARLHRRLRTAVAAATASVAARGLEDLGLADVVAELKQRAVELDAQLVLADRAPKPARRRMLRELQAETFELERLVERVMRMSRAFAGAVPSERGLGVVRERLELLESALRELDGVEVHHPVGRRQP